MVEKTEYQKIVELMENLARERLLKFQGIVENIVDMAETGEISYVEALELLPAVEADRDDMKEELINNPKTLELFELFNIETIPEEG